MINELYNLSAAMNGAGVKAKIWSRKYIALPNISAKKPCYRITIQDGKVLEISTVDQELGNLLRKYGSNHGSFPIMNLTPLYLVTDNTIKTEISKLTAEMLNDDKLEEIRSWCQNNNWVKKSYRDLYRGHMERMPNELEKLIPNFEPLKILTKESRRFIDPQVLHQELESKAFTMLAERRNISLALGILFLYKENENKKKEDRDNILIALETPCLVDMGIPAVSDTFVTELNAALLASEGDADSGELDAFGSPYSPINDPMPEVKLKGIKVSLRTMSANHECQRRYRRIESASYPISLENRKNLQAALEWLGSKEQEGKTWTVTDNSEILFAYPSKFPETPFSFVNTFSCSGDSVFSACAKGLIDELRHGKEIGSDSKADGLQIFVLKKIDDGRTKVMYSHPTDARELEVMSEQWTAGGENLPEFPFEKPEVIFPTTAADVLNRYWKENGELIKRKDKEKKIKLIPKYHGIQLMLEPSVSVVADLHHIAEQATKLGGFVGSKAAVGELKDEKFVGNQMTVKKSRKKDDKNSLPFIDCIKEMLSLAGILLYREGIRKENYMDNLPYLLGQLLKVSDELQMMYCRIVRGGDLPTQLAGSGMYRSAAEYPVRTLNMLGTRMNPYITWAKTYRAKDETAEGKESWRAGWLLSLYENIATNLHKAWQSDIRFGDAEKAQLFIGYLAKFPKKENGDLTLDENTENNNVTEDIVNE